MGGQPVWYVMRFLYNRKSDTRKRLDKAAVETFVPMHCEVRIRNGRKVRADVPVIRDLLFVHSTKTVLAPFLEADNYFQYRYRRGGGQAEPLVVPDSQMEQFIQAVKGAERPIYFTPQELNISRGTKIRIHGGPFDGIEGVFMKVKGARAKRLVIELPGTLAVAVEANPDLIEIISE